MGQDGITWKSLIQLCQHWHRQSPCTSFQPWWSSLVILCSYWTFTHLELDDVLHLVAGQVQLDAVINLQAQGGHNKFNAEMPWFRFQIECSRISV